MKKFFTLIAAALLGMSANAQLATGEYYVQNVESGLFLSGANAWGTQASATVDGEMFYVAPVEGGYTLTGVLLNSGNKTLGYNLYVDTNTSQNGNVWTIAPVAGEEGVYTLYGQGKKDNVEGAFEGYVAQGTVPGSVIGFPLVSAAEVTDAAKWRFLTKEQAIANLKSGDNATFLIDNANFTRNRAVSTTKTKTAGPWKISENCTNAALNGGDNSNTCAESFHSPFDINQTVKVPNGIYTVTVQCFYRQDGTDNENLPVVYANNVTKEFLNITLDGVDAQDDFHTREIDGKWLPNTMANASNLFKQGKYTVEAFDVEVTDGQLTLGVKNEANGELWCIWDNFQIVAKELAEEAEYTVYAKVTAGEDGTKTFVGQNLKVSTLGGVATVTLPAATAGGFAMESQDVKVNINAEGEITMIEGQTLNFTAGATKILVTVTGVEGSLVDGKVKVFVTAKGDNGKDVNVIYSTDEIVDPQTETITWDFSEYTERVVLADDNYSVDYNGMTMVGSTTAGYTSDYVDATAGFHMNGTSSATTRHLVYTPEKDGKLTVTYRSNNATATDRITAIGTEVVKGSDLAALLENEKVIAAGLTDGATQKTITADVQAGTTYYIYFASGGQSIMKVEFESVDVPTAVKTAKVAKAENKVAKFVKNGKVVIVKDGKAYTVAGAAVK